MQRAISQLARHGQTLFRTHVLLRKAVLPSVVVMVQPERRWKSTAGGSAGKGVKGTKGRKWNGNDKQLLDDDEGENGEDGKADGDGEEFNIDDGFVKFDLRMRLMITIYYSRDYDNLANTTMNVTKSHLTEQSVFLIQPYVKWGPRKSDTEPDLKLQEAEALVRSLPQWSIACAIKVPLESLEKRQLFGTGKLQELRSQINQIRGSGGSVSCIFISKGTLSGSQKRFLEKFFGLPIMDRYSIVIQILRLHATSTEAKLQVAAAEIPYIWGQLKDGGGGGGDSKGSSSLSSLSDTQKEMLRTRERKLRRELASVRSHRELLRTKRKHMNFPIVAVVGYTNAGKTSLIKALTSDESMQPRDQLFATLDVTAHAGVLPSKLKVIYMDTVGFMSDIPTGLIECFVATLEDAMLADVIVHVHDVSHPNHIEQSKHVEQTLESLLSNTQPNKDFTLSDHIINAGNKSDLLLPSSSPPIPNLTLISSKTGSGVDELLHRIECDILRVTNRSRLTIKVPMGGPEASWLYKNAAVTETAADPTNSQNLMLNVIISQAELQKFRHQFVTAGKKKTRA